MAASAASSGDAVAEVAPADAGAIVVREPRGGGRPDLSEDAFADLRAQQKKLKAEAKKMAAEVRKRQRAKARIVRKVRDLSVADIVHVLEPDPEEEGDAAEAAALADDA
jgi:hypothetical protein